MIYPSQCSTAERNKIKPFRQGRSISVPAAFGSLNMNGGVITAVSLYHLRKITPALGLELCFVCVVGENPQKRIAHLRRWNPGREFLTTELALGRR